MTILEFIDKYYPVAEKIRDRQGSDPYSRIANEDDLPFDRIGPDEDGHVTKLVEIDDTRVISVMDLISSTREDILKLDDQALLQVYDNYMSQVEIKSLDLNDFAKCVQMYRESRGEDARRLNVLRL